MKYKAYNRSNRDVSDLEQMMKSFMPFAQKRIGFNRPPTINFESDDVNAKNALGKTGFYDPAEMSITVFVDGRHPKDVLRSLSHELVHHGQNCRGDLNSAGVGEQGYAQKDPHLREMEREAYEVGNLCFRDWEDNYKQQTNYVQVDVSLSENRQLRSKTMGINDKRYNTLNKGLMERWGYKLTEEEEEEALNEFGAASSREEPGSGERRKKERGDRYQAHEEVEHEEEVVEESDEVFAPNHYCVHHGGVQHNGKIEMAEAVSHNYNRKLRRATHYNMKLSDGTILENVAAEDIQVTNASLAEGHSHPANRDKDEETEAEKRRAKRDKRKESEEQEKKYKGQGKKGFMSESEEELEEAFGQAKSADPPRKGQTRGGARPAGEDCDPKKDATCVPEPGEKAVASQAKERYGESMIRKIVRETIRRKLKKNG